MTQKVQVYRSNTFGHVPSSLLPGELAVNMLDKRLWFGDNSGVPVDPIASVTANLATEAVNRTAADSAEATTRAAAITSEATTRAAADTLLTAQVARRSPKEWGAVMNGSTDDSVAFADALVALRNTNSLLVIPGGSSVVLGSAARLAGKTLLVQGCGIVGTGLRDNGATGTGAYGGRGSTIRLTDTVASPFTVTQDWSFEGLEFFWPNQVESVSAPIIYPALITCASSTDAHSGRFCNNDVINAYTVMDFTAAHACGALHIHGNRAFFLKAFLRLSAMQVESWLTNNDWSPYAYQNVALGSGATYLKSYASNNAAVIEITGNGTASTRSTNSVDALLLDNNYTYGINTGIRIVGGMLDLTTINNCGFDGVSIVLAIGTGGLASDVTFNGGHWYLYNGPSPTTPAAGVSVASDACGNVGGNSIHVNNVTCPSIAGPMVDWRGTNGRIVVRGNYVVFNDIASGAHDAIVLTPAAGNTELIVTDNRFRPGQGGSRYGIVVSEGQPLVQIVGNVFEDCSSPISLAGTFASLALVIAGNISTGTVDFYAVAGAFGGLFVDSSNQWDKPVQGPSLNYRASDGALIFRFNGTDRFVMRTNGVVSMPNCPTAPGALSAGDIWRDNTASNVLKIV